MNLQELNDKTYNWFKDRGMIENGRTLTQVCKLQEEAGELAAAALRNNLDNLKDSIGDCLVVLTSIAILNNLTIQECWEASYEEIKDRKGYVDANGCFIKENDRRVEA